MFHHYHKIFLLNHLLPDPDVTNMIKNRMNDIITFITHDEYQYLLQHKILKLPNITYELGSFPRQKSTGLYGYIKALIDYRGNSTHMLFDDCVIKGTIHKPVQNNDKLIFKPLDRNDVIMI